MSKLRRIYGQNFCYFVTIKTHKNKKILNDPKKIKVLVGCMNFLQENEYINIIAWVIMPDHVHLLWEVIGHKNISEIMHSFKSYAANQISKLTINQRRGAEASAPRAGNIKIPGGEASPPRPIKSSRPRPRVFKIWQKSFYDHVIRDEIDFENHVNYIHFNPVKHGYVKNPEDWPWSSYRDFY